MIIHPNDDDFGTDPLNIGKVIIWTGQNLKDYHTLYQKDDRIVEIEVKFPPSQPKTIVYFRVIDFDDQSPYAINSTLPNTNYEAIGTNGVGLHTSSMASGIGEASLARPVDDSQGFKIATCYLKTTDRYSGDNYKVQASLDPSFSPGSIVETSNLVAWKRAYVDVRYMWKTGSYVTGDISTPENFVFVRNTDDFNVGDQIEIFYFDENQSIDTRTVTSKTDVRLRFDNDDPLIVPLNAGVIKSGTNYSLETTNIQNGFDYPTRLKDGFGFNGNGNDENFDFTNAESGGGFVEFKYRTKSLVPNFRGFQVEAPLNLMDVYSKFNKYWHDGQPTGNALSDSRYTLIIGRDVEGQLVTPGVVRNTVGFSEALKNYSFVATEKLNIQLERIQMSINEMLNTVTHEIAHQFETKDNINGHVDTFTGSVLSNDTEFPCIMSYSINNEQNPNSEFCSHHNHGFGGEDNSCMEDIRKSTWPN